MVRGIYDVLKYGDVTPLLNAGSGGENDCAQFRAFPIFTK